MNENEKSVVTRIPKKNKNKWKDFYLANDIYKPINVNRYDSDGNKCLNKKHEGQKNRASSALNLEEQTCTISKRKKKKSHQNDHKKESSTDSGTIINSKLNSSNIPINIHQFHGNNALQNENRSTEMAMNGNASYINSNLKSENRTSEEEKVLKKKKKNKSNMDDLFTHINDSGTGVKLELNNSEIAINSNGDLQSKNNESLEVNVLKKKKRKSKSKLNSSETSTNSNASYVNSDLQSENRTPEEENVLKKKKRKKSNMDDLFTHINDSGTGVKLELNNLEITINSDSDLQNKNNEPLEVNVLKKRKKNKSKLNSSETSTNNNEFYVNSDLQSEKKTLEEGDVLKKKKKNKSNMDDLFTHINDSGTGAKLELNNLEITINSNSDLQNKNNEPLEVNILKKKKKNKSKLNSSETSTNNNESVNVLKKRKKSNMNSKLDYGIDLKSESNSLNKIKNDNESYIDNNELDTEEMTVSRKKKKKQEKSESNFSSLTTNNVQSSLTSNLQNESMEYHSLTEIDANKQNKKKSRKRLSNSPISQKCKKLKKSTKLENYLEIDNNITAVNMDDINHSIELALEKTKIAAEDAEILKSLHVLIPWEVPKSHQIETRMSHPTTEQRKKFNDLDIKMKTGLYTKAEDAIIQKNWKDFIKTHQLPDKPELFMTSPGHKRHCLHWKERIKFIRYLGRNLENRMLFSIYLRFIKLFKNVKKGVFSKEEDEIILTYMKNSNNLETSYKLAILLNRSRNAIQARYSKLSKAYEHIKWTLNMKEQLIKYLLKITKETEIEKLENFDINEQRWKKVEKKLNIPVKKLRAQWYISLAPQLFTKESTSLLQIRKKLIHKLYELNLDDRKALNWNELAEDFVGITASRLSKIFQDLLKRMPISLKTDYKETIKYLKDCYLESCEDDIKIVRLKYTDGKLTYL